MISRSGSRRSWGFWLRAALPFAVLAYFLADPTFLTPDELFVILFLVFLSYGLAIAFIKMFLPFLGLLVSYDALRGFVPFVSKHVHYSTMIDFDRWVGRGTIPTHHLQKWMYHGHLMWYDFYFYGLYMMHFVIPVLFGVLIWRTRAKQYWTYVWSLVVLSYSGFLTHLAFPAAPPWMAARDGYIPQIEKLSTDIWFAFGVHNFPTLYSKFSPNQVAAVPSLHSAYPTLVMLFIWKLYGRKWGMLALLYPMSIWLGVVYMGEHYLFDVILGALYAAGAFFVTPYLMRAVRSLLDRRRVRKASVKTPTKPAVTA